jgi:hypothetical protein
MKRLLKEKNGRMYWAIAIAIAWFVCQNPAGAYDSPGIEFELYIQEGLSPQFLMGSPVPLIIVVKNTTGRPVFTERGFSQIELHEALIVTGPDGMRYNIRPADAGHRMPSPFFLNEKAYGLAESIIEGWSRSAKINDIRALVPVMQTVPGWYTIEAQQPFVRFAATADVKGLGFLAQLENPSNWHGPVFSNKLQVFIKPSGGGQPEIRIEDASTNPAKALFQIPVRLFKKSDIPAGQSLSVSWNALQPALAGTTDSQGVAKWTSQDPCLVQTDYSVIAKYGDRFGDTSITAGTAGWTPGACSGILKGTITFAAQPPPQQVITVKGSAYNYPQTNYNATFSMDLTTAGGTPSGWLKYYYSKTRMTFASTGLTQVTASGTTAKIKGTGTVNGKTGYTFEADVFDGSPDQFGIVIRNSNGTTYYSAPLMSIRGGSLTVTIK